MADLSDKVREHRDVVERIASEEQLVRRRIDELKQLIAEKQKRIMSLAALQEEEAKLLERLK